MSETAGSLPAACLNLPAVFLNRSEFQTLRKRGVFTFVQKNLNFRLFQKTCQQLPASRFQADFRQLPAACWQLPAACRRLRQPAGDSRGDVVFARPSLRSRLAGAGAEHPSNDSGGRSGARHSEEPHGLRCRRPSSRCPASHRSPVERLGRVPVGTSGRSP